MHIVFLDTMLESMSLNYLITYSSKFDCVTQSYIETLSWSKLMLFVRLHMSDQKPELLARVSFLIFMLLKTIFMVDPVTILIMKYSCCYLSVFFIQKLA